jgi:thioredoxin-related protein
MHIVKVMSVISWMFFFSASPLNMGLNEKIPWLSLQESEVAYKKEKKPILIDLYTNWCGWCKVMDKKTYANKNVIGYLNEKFYTVKLNAENKRVRFVVRENFSF